jgi:tRNA A-37 threonylcarbamoyl transferase component Bud32
MNNNNNSSSVFEWMEKNKFTLFDICEYLNICYHPYFWFLIYNEKTSSNIKTNFYLGRKFMFDVFELIKLSKEKDVQNNDSKSVWNQDQIIILKWIDKQKEIFFNCSIEFNFYINNKFIEFGFDSKDFVSFSIVSSLFHILEFRSKKDNIPLKFKVIFRDESWNQITSMNRLEGIKYFSLNMLSKSENDDFYCYENDNPLFFVFVDFIDKGTYGRIYLGNIFFEKKIKNDNIEQKKKYGIKELTKEDFRAFTKKTKRKNFLNECRIMYKLKGRNGVTQLLAAGENNLSFYMIYDWIEGKNLLHFLLCMNKNLEENHSKRIFKQMLNILNILKKEKIAHHDIKLENFLIDSDLNIHLIDFGLSEIISDSDLSKLDCGSFEYIPPEKLIYNQNIHNSVCYNAYNADLWSISICLYAMIFFRFPNSKIEIQQSIIKNKKYPEIKFDYCSISSSLKDLLIHLLEIDSNKRMKLEDVYNHSWINENITPFL